MSALRGYRDYAEERREPLLAVAPPLVLAAIVLCSGLYLPHWLTELLRSAAAFLEGRPA